MKSKQQEAAPVSGQHTPGPWRIGSRPGYVACGQGDDSRTIAIVQPENCYADEVSQAHQTLMANARLIAAAPALLEALKKCKAAVENGNLPPSARMELVRDYATPTIAAAEGRVA